jgi:hypothetical protein
MFLSTMPLWLSGMILVARRTAFVLDEFGEPKHP